MYLSLIALSQAINVVFILDGKNYLMQYINITPLLVLTSICTRKLLVNTKSFNHEEKGISSRSIIMSDDNPKNFPQFRQHEQSLGTFIDQFYLQDLQQQQRQNYSQQQDQQQEPNYQRSRQS